MDSRYTSTAGIGDLNQLSAAIPATRVEVSVSCRNLLDRDTFSKSDPICVLYVQGVGNKEWREFGRTEVIDNTLNPDFVRKFILDYFFEERENLRFDLYDVDSKSPNLSKHDFLGQVFCTLGEIVGSQGSRLEKPIVGIPGKKCGTIILTAEELNCCRKIVTFSCDLLMLIDSCLMISLLSRNGKITMTLHTESNDGQLNLVNIVSLMWANRSLGIVEPCCPFWSPSVCQEDNEQYVDWWPEKAWKLVASSTSKNGEGARTLTMPFGNFGTTLGSGVPKYRGEDTPEAKKELFAIEKTLSLGKFVNITGKVKSRHDCAIALSSVCKTQLHPLCSSHDFIGEFTTSYRELSRGQSQFNVYEVVNPKKKGKKKKYSNSGTVTLLSFLVETEVSFLDYIKGGTQINFTVAIDFTASNGNPAQPTSLHYMNPYQLNAYGMALKAVGEIVQDYDSDKMFPALGFGAKLPPDGRISHEFALNGNPQNPYCDGIEGVMEAYYRSLKSVQLYGPTNFAPVINHVARYASSVKDGSQYFVLLIVTDGVISDMAQTKESIVNASKLPMSIIIVGVGPAEFDAMVELDGDDVRVSSRGKYAERDIVQFVPFRDYIDRSGNHVLSMARLAKDVLAEIPEQFLSYMRARGIKPSPAPPPYTPPTHVLQTQI
ncbi:copine-8 [Piliocolobus tephrosceles]|nr:copine-8 [Piliocolobus tephrosceles]